MLDIETQRFRVRTMFKRSNVARFTECHVRSDFRPSTALGRGVTYDHRTMDNLRPQDEGSPTTTSLCFRHARRRRATNTGRGARLHRGGPHDRTASIARQPTRAYAVSAGSGKDLRHSVVSSHDIISSPVDADILIARFVKRPIPTRAMPITICIPQFMVKPNLRDMPAREMMSINRNSQQDVNY